MVDAVWGWLGQDRCEAWMAAMASGDSRAMLTEGMVVEPSRVPAGSIQLQGWGQDERPLERMPRGVDQDVPFIVTAFPQPLDDAVDHRRVGHRTGAHAMAPPTLNPSGRRHRGPAQGVGPSRPANERPGARTVLRTEMVKVCAEGHQRVALPVNGEQGRGSGKGEGRSVERT